VPDCAYPLPEAKKEKLEAIIAGFPAALVAYSGGVDSTLLAKLAHDILGDRVLAVTVRTVAIPAAEAVEAAELAAIIGVRHRLIDVDVLTVPELARNSPDRCYACKKKVFGILTELARAEGLAVVLDGSNADDSHDYRPGMAAARELGVRSPLQEAGLSKAEVRALLQYYGLPNWNKPASPCLVTRFPYGTAVTPAGLRRVEKAEAYLHQHGFAQVRVRHHGDLARIEVPAAEMSRLVSLAGDIAAYLQVEVGFRYVTLDMQGFRSGSMDEGLAQSVGKAG
jgi:uncharacterized protein